MRVSPIILPVFNGFQQLVHLSLVLSQYAIRAEAVVTRLEATGPNSTQEER